MIIERAGVPMSAVEAQLFDLIDQPPFGDGVDAETIHATVFKDTGATVESVKASIRQLGALLAEESDLVITCRDGKYRIEEREE